MDKQNLFHRKRLIILTVCMLFGIIQKTIAQDQIPAAIREEENNISAKIEAVLKADKANYDKMKAQLEAISAIKDEAKREPALNNYKTAFGAVYGQAVKRAGVDMNAFIAEWSKRFPDFEFSTNNDYAIMVKKRKVARPAKNGRTTSPTSPATVNITDFQRTKEVHCGEIGFGAVDFETIGVKASSTGAVAGGCIANGVLTNNTTLSASASSITLMVKAKLELNGFALGVAGISVAQLSAEVSAAPHNSNNYFLDEYRSEMVLAPFGWYGSIDDSQEVTSSMDISDQKGKKIDIQLFSNAFTESVLCCATNGTSHTKLISAQLITVN